MQNYLECNSTDEGFERFACPTPDHFGRFRCIEDRLFCDGYYDCPGGEDEERVSCMYYKLVSIESKKAHNSIIHLTMEHKQRKLTHSMSILFLSLSKQFVSHIDILTNTFLTWMKKQNRLNAHRTIEASGMD